MQTKDAPDWYDAYGDPPRFCRQLMGERSSCNSRPQFARWRYSLRGVLVFISVIAVSLAISRLLHPLWVILFFAYALLAYGFARPAVFRRFWLPLTLTAFHTVLVTIASAIEYASAWDDMSPTMLVMMAGYILDFPIHFAFMQLQFAPRLERLEFWYLAQLVVTGGLLWFGVGLLLKMFLSVLKMLFPKRS